MIAKIIAKIDNFLFKKIGIVTPLRRAYWRRSSIKIQKEIDIEQRKIKFVHDMGANCLGQRAIDAYNNMNNIY